MYSGLECGVCYLRFNSGARCPRELQCRHVFCHSCLTLLARCRRDSDGTSGLQIRCPLCRHSTSMSGDTNVQDLPVTQSVLEGLRAEGAPEDEEEEESRQEADLKTEQGDSSVGSRRVTLRRSFRRVWRKIVGKREGDETLSDIDFRDLVLMSSSMF